jgi:hypothetical protein
MPPTPDMAELAPPENVRVNDPTDDDLAHDHTTQTETTLAVFGDNVLVGFVDTGHVLPLTPGVSSLAGYALSTDRGRSFTDLGQAPPVANDVGRADPTLAVDRAGNYFLSSLQRDGRLLVIGLARSTDGGRTFARPVTTRGLEPAGFNDKSWMVADDTGGAFDGQLYLAWTESATEDGAPSRILLARSTDHGLTLGAPMALTAYDDQQRTGVSLAVGPNGEVYVAWPEIHPPDYLTGSMVVTRSLDGGVTWSPLASVADFQPPPWDDVCESSAVAGHVRSFSMPNLAVDRSDGPARGRVYFTYLGGTAGDAGDVFLQALDPALAPIGGPVRVNDDQTTNDQAFPAMAVGGDGTVGVAFLDRRRDPYNHQFELFFAVSRDGGAHFQRNRRISQVPFDVPPIFDQPTSKGGFDSERSSCFMGDYIHVIADSERFYMVWGDARNTVISPAYPQGRPDPDVYFASVPIAEGR